MEEVIETKEKEERVKTDWLAMIFLFLVVGSACVITYFIIIGKVNVCTSNPLKYQADLLSKEVGVNYSYAWVGIYKEKNSVNALTTKELDFGEQLSFPYTLG